MILPSINWFFPYKEEVTGSNPVAPTCFSTINILKTNILIVKVSRAPLVRRGSAKQRSNTSIIIMTSMTMCIIVRTSPPARATDSTSLTLFTYCHVYTTTTTTCNMLFVMYLYCTCTCSKAVALRTLVQL